jgi:hypothetical protein
LFLIGRVSHEDVADFIFKHLTDVSDLRQSPTVR